MKKKSLIVLGVLTTILIILALYVRLNLYPQFPVANGYAAKKMCSCIFIADRTQESIQKEDLGFGPLGMTSTLVDYSNKSVETSIFGMAKRKAVFRGDVGCILLKGKDDYNISLDISRRALDPSDQWPQGEATSQNDVSGVEYTGLRKAIDELFEPNGDMDSSMTRAVVVIYKDTLIAEGYANGFDLNTEILGWSMTKSITATMIGMLIQDGHLSLDDDHLFEEWQDDRSNIKLKDLLQMQSGLAFDENYGAISDATNMLYQSENISDIPLSKSLIHPPGTHWSYSSGTTNLLNELVRRHVGDSYLEFPYDRIFNKLGMNSAILETDESGRYIGSSYMYATPRDWARFGLMYLNQGSWAGEQLLDTSFVDFVRSPVEDSNGEYGGQFWLNADPKVFPNCPSDVYFPSGFQGQHVFIIPSYDAIIVRMGLQERPVFSPDKLISSVLQNLTPVSEN